jgi:hypothetical protein
MGAVWFQLRPGFGAWASPAGVYRVSCIVDISGDEINSAVTAAGDEEAIE